MAANIHSCLLTEVSQLVWVVVQMTLLPTTLTNANNATRHAWLARNIVSVCHVTGRARSQSYTKRIVLRNAQLDFTLTVMVSVLNAIRLVLRALVHKMVNVTLASKTLALIFFKAPLVWALAYPEPCQKIAFVNLVPVVVRLVPRVQLNVFLVFLAFLNRALHVSLNAPTATSTTNLLGSVLAVTQNVKSAKVMTPNRWLANSAILDTTFTTAHACSAVLREH